MVMRAGLVLGLLLVWLIVLLPLKAVVMLAGGDRLGFSDVYGTVWDGRIYDLDVQGVAIRETAVQLKPLGLLTGRLVVDWQVDDPELRGRGKAVLGGNRIDLSRTDISVTLDRLDAPDLPGLDRAERVQLRLGRLELDQGVCRQASGDARLGALASLAAGYGLDGPVLTGQFACRDDRLVLDFTGTSDGLELSGDVVFETEAMVWSLTAQTDEAAMADMLAIAGLRREGDVWRGEGRQAYAGYR
ncbi:type II secretion system protein N [Maricaulis parjimensis]|uniref:type II secretion system protein N n=1 Tax=Maricaulis parjimensis TaxID=144023 RepID=UPI001939A850|nr:type II secretion system protein N [Maricaulis parjimensis]